MALPLLPLLAALAAAPALAAGHAMLVQPPNRGSMWRYGYNTPVNYNDNEQFCGGREIQWGQNGGKCGECGDDWSLPRPRPAENGGKFGTGTIAGTYRAGQAVTLTAMVTANHWGGFLFRLCPLPGPGALESEECFQQHPLYTVDGEFYYPLPSDAVREYAVDVQLPEGLTCRQCVLQWTYLTGNDWGVCNNGTGVVGCGPQETFRTCSDITIV